MITNTAEVLEAINLLQTENESLPKKFSNKMTPDEYNSNLDAIKNQLNSLYEKIRTLQELNDFCKTYLNAQLNNKIAEFREKIKTIEDGTGTLRESGCVSQDVLFISSNEKINDRDSSSIPKMEVVNGSLKANSSNLFTGDINAISTVSEFPRYNNSYENLKKNEPGCSCYLTQETYIGGVSESTTFTLKTPREINYIRVEPVNCKIIKIELISAENVVEKEVLPNEYFDPALTSSVRITVESEEYTKSVKMVEKDSYEASNFEIDKSSAIRKPKEKNITVNKIENDHASKMTKHKSNKITLLSQYVNKLNEKISNRNNILAVKKS